MRNYCTLKILFNEMIQTSDFYTRIDITNGRWMCPQLNIYWSKAPAAHYNSKTYLRLQNILSHQIKALNLYTQN